MFSLAPRSNTSQPVISSLQELVVHIHRDNGQYGLYSDIFFMNAARERPRIESFLASNRRDIKLGVTQ
jgi:hypothetical protein